MYDVVYKESIFVGYRYYDIYPEEIMYPFGFGLSYTNFKYSNFKIKNNKVCVDITNTGKRTGKEIVKLYIGKKDSKTLRPIKELKGFKKIELDKDETKTVEFKIDDNLFKIYDSKKEKWITENGDYEIYIGSSSRDIKFEGKINIKSNDKISKIDGIDNYIKHNLKEITDEDFENLYLEDIKYTKKTKVNMNSTIEQLKYQMLPYYLYKKYIIMPKLMKTGNTNKATKVMMDLQKPLRNYCRKKKSKYTKIQVEGFIDFQNGHLIKGIKGMRKND